MWFCQEREQKEKDVNRQAKAAQSAAVLAPWEEQSASPPEGRWVLVPAAHHWVVLPHSCFEL